MALLYSPKRLREQFQLGDRTRNAQFWSGRSVDMDIFPASYANANEARSRETAKKLNIKLIGEPKRCDGYSLAKCLWKSILSSLHFRATVQLEREFMDLFGPKRVHSRDRKSVV